HPVAEGEVDVPGFGQPQRDAGREQVPKCEDLLARVLGGGDDVYAAGAALGEEQPEGGLDAVLGLPVGDVGGQGGEFVDDDDVQRLLDGRGVLAGDAAQAAGTGLHDSYGVLQAGGHRG